MICPHCGKTIDNDTNFCQYCGVQFVGEEEKISAIPEETIPTVNDGGNPEQPKKNRKPTVFQIIICVIVLIVVAVGLLIAGLKMGNIGGETVTDAVGEEYHEGKGKVTISVKDIDGTVRSVESDRALLTKESILAEYTSVMNKLKNDSPGFTVVNYQNLPTDKGDSGAISSIALPLIEKYVTSKSVALPKTLAAGNANLLPLKNSSYGCLLTDASKIKNAHCEILADGTYQLVITLVDDVNPTALNAGATSTTGTVNAVFNPYEAAEMITSISSLVQSSINFTYTDCTVTLAYDNSTKNVQSIKTEMNIDIEMQTLLKPLNAHIQDITEYTSFVY